MAYDALLNVQPIEVTGIGTFENDYFKGNGSKVFGGLTVSNASEGATIEISVEETNDGTNYSLVRTIATDSQFVQEPYFSNEVSEKVLSYTGNVNDRFKFRTNGKFRFSYNVVGTATIGINIGNS
ncbi:hypothetical protein JMM81_20715 [Bacillus sp. V3B]|uniref:hypothetical protein n=1 Tax=Bacillus sp. V3B TaxID=2804915 RepID=UPI0021086AD1|nr:hypothetical protein [Bacillus sp. V3B]MCQ6277299.1 hypothetical protein [Bacillus sp. V3B]